MSEYENEFCLPFVAGIIERQHDGRREVLIQTRQKLRQSIYNGTFEFTAGVIEAYEDVHETLAREIKEETGLTLKTIIGGSRTETLSPQKIDGAFGFRPFCCLQQLRDGAPWVGFVFRCEVEGGDPIAQQGETEDVHWVEVNKLRSMIEESPERFFTLELPAWRYYFREVEE